jgi:uncharacterized RDD family membrane protein YckC
MSLVLTKDGIVPRSLVGTALASSFVWFYWFQKNPVGFISETINGVTHVVAGSSPAVVSLSILGLFLFIFVMTREVQVETFQASSLKRRFAAFALDCWYLLLTVVGVSSLIHLLLEAHRNGTFRWRYEVETGTSDGGDAAIVLINLTVMFMYFVVPLARRKQTVGQWLFRLATVSAGGSFLYLSFSTALWRTLMAFRGLISPWRFLKETDAQGRTWYDRETGFTVVRF